MVERSFIFFRIEEKPEGDLPPVYARDLSDLEEYLESKGVKLRSLWKERLKEGRIYENEIYGVKYRYGFTVDGDTLLFLFTIPSALKVLERVPVEKAREVMEVLWKGFLVREFVPTGGFQMRELILGTLYVGTDW